jgi:hypothetical protein
MNNRITHMLESGYKPILYGDFFYWGNHGDDIVKVSPSDVESEEPKDF